ncbi:MAG: antibiotic biosynthesis monooxygenase [Methanoregula sp.]|nr:antibiotic biosynthesis monooxygenase [Methanoregula sp.]
MILVDAQCSIVPERLGDFIREAWKIMPVVRKESGCSRYELLSDVSVPGLYHFIEEWESRQHLDDHIAQPHMKEYFAKTTPWHAAPTTMKIYTIRSSQPGTKNK